MLEPIRRLGATDTRPTLATLDRWARVVCYLAIGLYLIHGTYASMTHRALYGDAAWFLLRIITEGSVTNFYTDFAQEFYYSRFLAYTLTQLPAVLSVQLGVDEPRALSLILGLTYFAHKPLSLLLCFRLLPAGRKGFIVFPLLAVFAGSINSELYIVTETHLAVSFLWPLLIGVTQLHLPGRVAYVAMGAGLLASAFVYESMAFFGPVLLTLCALRAYAERERRAPWVWLSLCALFPIAINWAAILYPRDPTNKSAFSNGVIKLFHDSLSGPATAHVLGLASMACVGVVAALLLRGLRPGKEGHAPSWAWGAAVVLAFAPAAHFLIYAAQLDLTHSITDRGFGGLLMQMAVLGLYLLVLVLPPRFFASAAPGAVVIACGLAAGQIGWQLLATRAWHASLNRLEIVTAARSGLQECTARTLGAAPASGPDPAAMLCHWWVLPLSVVLAPDSGVGALLVSQESFLPFDPRVPASLPNTPERSINYAPYLRANSFDRKAPVTPFLEFTERGGGRRHFRSGFSTPEAWATWTDGARAELDLCFGTAVGRDPVLEFKVAPQVTAVRPRLGVALDIGGVPSTTWTFELGQGVVERRLILPRASLDGDGCAIVGLTFDDDRPATEIGVPNDPRRLGLALLSLRAHY